MAGTRIAESCAQHPKDGIVGVKRKTGRTECCSKYPRFGVASIKTPEYYGRYASAIMVDIKGKNTEPKAEASILRLAHRVQERWSTARRPQTISLTLEVGIVEPKAALRLSVRVLA